jgi:hypothetical protein
MPKAYSSMAETGASMTRESVLYCPEIGGTETLVPLKKYWNFLFYNYRLRHGDSYRLGNMYRNLYRDAYWIRNGFLDGDWVRLRNVDGIRPINRNRDRNLDRDWNFLLDSYWIRLWDRDFDFLRYRDGLHFTMSHGYPSKSVVRGTEVPMASYVESTGAVAQTEDAPFLRLRVFLLLLFR